jgi:glycosyltransferase involved in cell wall biosynthesis
VRTLDIDLMFCPFTAVFYSAPGVPTVVVVADLQYRYYPQFFTIEQNFHADNNFRKVCQVATRLICLSDFTRQTVIEQGKVAPEQAVTIYPSFWSALSVQPAEQVKLALEKWHLEESQYLFFPANFWPHKNHAMLLTAFNMFCHLHPESSLKLVLSGAPGERMSALQKAASQMGLSERVVFTGYLRPPEVSALLQGCLALIFPSLFEGFGMPALEAMQFGKPVLCSQATSLPEVCGEAALYFDPRLPGEMLGAIENLVGDPGLAFHLAEKGRQQALRFNDPAAWAENNFQVLEDTFQRKRVFHDGVDGLYEDGWAGPWLEISSAGGIGRQLDIELEAPAWLPQKLTVSITGKVAKALEEQIPPGGKRALSLPLAASGGIVQLKFYPSISPLELHHNQDQRKLSCRINSCRLKSGGVELDLLNKEPQ